MLDFCQTERLRVTNTYYPHSIANKASWDHPGSRNPGLLDYALVRTVDAAFVTNCRHYPNPNVDVDSDHVLGILDMRQRPCARAPRVAGPAPPAGRLPQPTRRLEVAPLRALGHQRLRSEAEFASLASSKVVATLTPSELPAVLYECGATCFGHAQGPAYRKWQVLQRDGLCSLACQRMAALAQFRADGSLQSRLVYSRLAKRIGLQYVAWLMHGGPNKQLL